MFPSRKTEIPTPWATEVAMAEENNWRGAANVL